MYQVLQFLFVITSLYLCVVPAAGVSANTVNDYIDWTLQVGSAKDDEAKAVAVDQEGNIYVGAHTRGDLLNSNQGSADAVLMKLNPSGSILWSTQFGTPTLDYMESIYILASGSVIVSGSTAGALSETDFGQHDTFIAEYNAFGEQQWMTQIGTPGWDLGRELDIDINGNILIAGSYQPGFGQQAEATLYKLNSRGNELWNVSIPANDTTRANRCRY